MLLLILKMKMYCILYNLALHKNIKTMRTKSGGEVKNKNRPSYYENLLQQIKLSLIL